MKIKLSVSQLMLGMFVVMWVISDASGVPPSERWIWATTAAMITGYINNVHRKIWKQIRRIAHV